jgi:hypothetical protein
MKDYSNYYPSYNDKLITDGQRVFEYQLSGIEGVDGLIDTLETRFLFQKHSNALAQGQGEYYVICKKSLNIQTGSIIKVDNDSYIVTSKIEDNFVYKKATVQQSNNTLKFYIKDNENGILWVLVETPCIITTPFKTNMGENSNKLITTITTDYQVIIPDNSLTKVIDVGTRFILNNRAFKCEGYDDLSNVGLKTIKLSLCEIDEVDDNLVEGIANFNSHQNIYEVIVLNGTLIKKFFGDTPFQLDVSCKANGEIVDNSQVTYISENEMICTVSPTGLITLVGTGITNIKVKFGNAETIIQIQSDVITQDYYNIVLTPSDSFIKSSRSISLSVMVTNNGITDPLKQVGFEITNVDGSAIQYATYTINNNSIVITAASVYNKYIKLKVYMLAYPDIYIERQIKIISLI